MTAASRDDTRLADIAAAERDHVAALLAALLAEHLAGCKRRRCPDCRSLRGHAERTRLQVGLLAAGGTEESCLF